MFKIVNTHFRKWIIPHDGNDYIPHFFRPRIMVYVALLTLLITVLSFSYSLILPRTDYLAAVLPSVLVDLVNDDREIYALGPLNRNPLLEVAAKEKAEDMARYGYFAHISPVGISPWYWISKSGYRFIYAGENLAINFSESRDVNKAWMDSPAHRANILNGNFTEIGIATAEGVYEGRQTIFAVQMFGRPVDNVSISVSPEQTAQPSSVKVTPKKFTIPKVPKIEPIKETETFIIVKNTETQTIPSSKVVIPQGAVVGTTQYATLSNKLLTNPRVLVRIVYGVLLVLVLLIISISLSVELKKHHGKHLVSGLILILFIFVLSFIYEHVATSTLLIV
ncbi:MAG TPA: CAP domain-containing protein [Candidatus Paceibacterota bacterium]